MRPAFLAVAIALLLPVAVMAQPPFGRQLHYAGTKAMDGRDVPVGIDVDIGRLDSERATWIVIDEREGERDLGPVHVSLDPTGVMDEDARLTFEEEAILDMVALQFEDMDGLAPGDHWNRRGARGHDTQYRVRDNTGNMLNIEISRRTALRDGGYGSWQGLLQYNSTIVAPVSIDLSGPMPFSARLVRDSFQAERN